MSFFTKKSSVLSVLSVVLFLFGSSTANAQTAKGGNIQRDIAGNVIGGLKVPTGSTVDFTGATLVGVTSSSVLYGAGVPGSGTGNNGDTYINTATGAQYKKAAGAWGASQVAFDLSGLAAAAQAASQPLDSDLTTWAGKTVTASAAELNFVSGVTSAIQPQIAAKANSSTTINGQPLTSNVTISVGGDVTAATTFGADGLLVVADGTGKGLKSTTVLPAVTITNLTLGTITGTVGVPNGGTGGATLTAYAPVFGGTTSTGAVQSGTVGTVGQVLTSNGPGQIPTFQAATGGGGGSVAMVPGTYFGWATADLANKPTNSLAADGTNGTLTLTPASGKTDLVMGNGTVVTPVFAPAAGSYSATQSVAITSTTPSTSIYYTVDGSTPTSASTAYSAPVSVASSLTLKAIAYKSLWMVSGSLTGVYTITPASDFLWNTQSFVSDYPTSGAGSGAGTNGTGTVSIDTGVFHTGTASFNVAAANYSTRNWWNESDSRIFANTSYGTLTFWWRYTGTYSAGSLLFQIGGKTQTYTAGDTNDSIGVKTRLVGGGNVPGLDLIMTAPGGVNSTSPDVAMETSGPSTWRKVTVAWNRNKSRTTYLQLDNAPPVYATTVWGPFACVNFHQLQIGNDTTNVLQENFSEIDLKNTWTFTLPGTVWQDFELASLSQAELEAHDHTASLTATFSALLTGTTSQFSIATGASKTSPSTINRITDTGTRGLRRDLSVTSTGSIGQIIPTTTSVNSWGFTAVLPTLTVGTSAIVGFAGQSNAQVAAVKIKNVSGTHYLALVDTAGTESATTYAYTPGSTYYIAVKAQRAATCYMRVYDSSGIQVGSGDATITAAATSLTGFFFGSTAATTAQAAATYIDVDNLVYDSAAFHPMAPFDL